LVEFPIRLSVGELTLTGEVFPIGGVREKLIAARRAGIKEIILPEDNRGEFEEVLEHMRGGFLIHFVSRFQDVVPLLFKDRRKTQT
jgi:ATP-dependent Lon protease